MRDHEIHITGPEKDIESLRPELLEFLWHQGLRGSAFELSQVSPLPFGPIEDRPPHGLEPMTELVLILFGHFIGSIGADVVYDELTVGIKKLTGVRSLTVTEEQDDSVGESWCLRSQQEGEAP